MPQVHTASSADHDVTTGASPSPARQRVREQAMRAPEPRPVEDAASGSAPSTEPLVIDDEPLVPEPRRSQRTPTNWGQIVLTTLATLAAGYAARAFVMPVAFALLVALTLRPVVRHLKRRGVPLPAGAAMVLLVVIVGLLAGVTYLVEPAKSWIESGPAKLKEVGERLSPLRYQWVQIQQASEAIKDLAKGNPEGHGPENPGALEAASRHAEPVPVEVQQPRLTSNLMVLNSAGSFLGGAVVTFVLAYFLLSAGDTLINNILRILPSMREKRNAVELVHNVEHGISSYLFTVTCINVVLGIVEAVAMWLLGMPNPALWGAMCCVLNFIPYMGAFLGSVVVFFVAVLTFDSLAFAVVVPIVYFGITAIEGNLVTPAILGRSMSLNPIMVFLSLTFWGWMWGIGGALLAVPLLTMLKIGFDQFERTRALGTLLGS